MRRHIAHRQSRRLITSRGAGGRRRIEKEKKKKKEEKEEAGEVLGKVVFSRPAGSPAHPTRSPPHQHHLFVLGPTSLKVQLTSPLTDSGFSLLLLPPTLLLICSFILLPLSPPARGRGAAPG